MAENDSAGVRSVQLAIDVLEAVAFSDEELGVTQIADRLHVTKGRSIGICTPWSIAVISPKILLPPAMRLAQRAACWRTSLPTPILFNSRKVPCANCAMRSDIPWLYRP